MESKKSNNGGRIKRYTQASKREISLPSNDTITRNMMQDAIVNAEKCDSNFNAYLKKDFQDFINPATENTDLTDTASTNPMKHTYGLSGLDFSDCKYQAGRTRIEVYSIVQTDEWIEGKPTYKIAKGQGPKGFRNWIRFVGKKWVNIIAAAAGAHVQTTLDGDYILVTGVFDSFNILVAPHANAPDQIDIRVDDVDTLTDLSAVQSSVLLTKNIRSNVCLSDATLQNGAAGDKIGGLDLHTIKITNHDSAADDTLNICGFEMITTAPQEQAGTANINGEVVTLDQQSVTDPTVSGGMGALAYRYIKEDGTRDWAITEPENWATTGSMVTGGNTLNLIAGAGASTGIAIDDLIMVDDDTLTYVISQRFRVTNVVGDVITTQENATVTNRAGAGYTFPVGSNVTLYGKCGATVDHSNEVISRARHPQSFGAGHVDDFQYEQTLGDHWYTLDDEITGLWTNDGRVSIMAGQLLEQTGLIVDDSAANMLAYPFHGTGLDVIVNGGNAANASSDSNWYVDGIKVIDAYSCVEAFEKVKVVSGLSNGGHILKIHQQDANAGHNVGPIVKFIEYESKDPSEIQSADKGQLISKKIITADYIYNTANTLDDFSKGVTYYAPNRGWKCIDSGTAWLQGGSTIRPFYGALYGEFNGTAATAERWFYGTGFELMIEQNNNRSQPKLKLDDDDDFSGFTLHYALATDLISNHPMQIEGYAAGSVQMKFGVTGLVKKWHKLEVITTNDRNVAPATDDYTYITGFGVIGGSATIDEPQGTLQQICSCMRGDSADIRRIFALESEEFEVNHCKTHSVTTTTTTSSTSFVPLQDISATIKSNGKPMFIVFNTQCYNDAPNRQMGIGIYINGKAYNTDFQLYTTSKIANYYDTMAGAAPITLPIGWYTITAYIYTAAGTTTFRLRHLNVFEIAGVKNEN